MRETSKDLKITWRETVDIEYMKLNRLLGDYILQDAL
jgi:hypothetical protein